VDGADADGRAAVSRRHPQLGAATLGPPASLKKKGGGGDDGDGMPTQARRDAGPTGQRVLSESGRWWCSRAELGPKGEGGSIGWLQPT
jgi:hypothetical protein